MDEMKAAGFDWGTLNLTDWNEDEWATTISRARQYQWMIVPSGRLASGGDTREAALARLEMLCETAVRWATKSPIINAETEIKPAALGGVVTPDDIAEALAFFGLDGAAISTEGFLYDIDWTPLRKYVAMLQVYPEDMKIDPSVLPTLIPSLVRRARDYGFTYVSVTAQGWRSDPSWYTDLRRGTAWNVAYADDIGLGNFALWTGDV